MTARLLKIGLLVTLIVAGAMGVLAVRRDNERMRRRAAEGRRSHEQVVQLRAENARIGALAAATAEPGIGAAAALQAELLRLRSEVAELENRDRERRTKAEVGAATLTANRDPEKDFVMVENFQNMGRGTPSAAFQTLIWAATKGDDRALADLLTFDGKVREQVESMLAGLPEPMRAKYPKAENLAALFFAHLVTGHTAARVLAQDVTDGQRATVTIGFERMPAGRALPVRLNSGGWQFTVTEEMAAEFQRQVRGASAQ